MRRENYIKFMYSEIQFMNHGLLCTCESCTNKKQKMRIKHVSKRNGKRKL
jgi:hypothetical protein